MVNGRFASAMFEPEVDVESAHFQFQCSGDPILRLETVIDWFMRVLVEINEAGSHDESFCLEDAFPLKGFAADSGDADIANAHMSNGIQTGLRIHCTPALNDEIIFFSGQQAG